MAIETYSKTGNAALSAHFNLQEFRCGLGSGCSCQSVKVDDRLVACLQRIRDHFGVPVTVNSGYRCAAYNRKVGGTSRSYHMTGQAADITVKGVAPVEVAKYAESIGVKGIGLYDGFVHIDTRTDKSFWYGSGQAYRQTFGGARDVTYSLLLRQLQKDDTGADVKALQRLLQVTADGIFGPKTESAVQQYQKAVGLGADGVVGEKTMASLLGSRGVT